MRKIGILLCDTENPFWRAKIVQYETLAASFCFDVMFQTAENSRDPEEQCREFLKMTRKDYDAVILNPLTADNLLSVLNGLSFPVFDVGPKCDSEKTAGIKNYFPVGVANFEEQGFLAGNALVSCLPPACFGWALILGGFYDARHSSLRCRGAFRAFGKVFPQERIVTVFANFSYEDAYRTVKDLAPKLDIRVVFCANDLMALGAADALQESAVGCVPPVGGVDAIPEALDALKDGRLFCTVNLPHEEVVRSVYGAVSDYFKGKKLLSEKTLARSALVLRPS